MMLTEQTSTPAAALPLAQFKDHMRLGTGFADDGAQDTLLEAMLRAALAAVEGRTGKILLSRTFLWSMTAWRGAERQALPVAPVVSVAEVRIVDRAGGVTVVDSGAYLLERDTHRPRLAAPGSGLPAIPLGGRVEVDFDAGFGAAWDAVPDDLAQAVLMLAAHYHEHRSSATMDEGGIPLGVMALLERWRTVRVLGGA